jgi:hypothetical protein
MVTLEQIKERFPEGCEVSCARLSDKKMKILEHKKIGVNSFGGFIYVGDHYFVKLYHATTMIFATIINPATENQLSKNQLSKYHVPCKGVTIDVYDVLKAFNVVNPATQHAIKKLLKGGERGFKDVNKDYQEAIESIERAIELNK